MKKSGRRRHLCCYGIAVPVSHLRYPLRFRSEDFAPLPLEELAVRMRVSRGLLRLCAAAGCPAGRGEMSSAGVLLWLFEHYEDLRAVAGLPPLVVVDGLIAETAARLRMANALVTLLEYSRTRASGWRQKRHLRLAMENVECLVDRSA